jgi:hypothetical protein
VSRRQLLKRPRSAPGAAMSDSLGLPEAPRGHAIRRFERWPVRRPTSRSRLGQGTASRLEVTDLTPDVPDDRKVGRQWGTSLERTGRAVQPVPRSVSRWPAGRVTWSDPVVGCFPGTWSLLRVWPAGLPVDLARRCSAASNVEN